MNKHKKIQIQVRKSVLNIVLDSPNNRNALSPSMIYEIQSTLDKYQNNKDIRVVLFSSSSSVFCAGADLKYLKSIINNTLDENLKDSLQLMNLFKTILSYKKIVISKVTGPAIAGGCGIVSASDFIFCTKESKFGYPEVKIGFIPALVSTFLKYKVSYYNAKKLLINGNIINAEEAKKIGLVDNIESIKKIDNKIDEFIDNHIRMTSPISIAQTKKLQYDLNNLETQLSIAAEYNANIRLQSDFKKGINSFLNKNSINWEKEK